MMAKTKPDTEKIKPDAVKNTMSLKRIWNIPGNLKCPLVGTCLTISEQRRILKKAGFSVKKEAPYLIHKTVMEHMGDRNKLSVKIDRFIRHKYRKYISDVVSLNEEQLRGVWQGALHSGDIEAVFYVIASHPDISEEFLFEVYGEVHMMSHANVEMTLASRRSLYMELHVNRKLSTLLNREKSKIKAFKLKNKKLLKALEQTRSQLAETKKQSAGSPGESKGMERLRSENRIYKNSVDHLEKQLAQMSDQMDQTEREKRKLQIKMFELQSTNSEFVNEINEFITRLSSSMKCREGCDATCPKFNLCEKRILVVGGITKIKHFYQQFVETNGGEFDYHDGYMNGGNKGLEDRVVKSDLIICPVNCNSHNACSKVKKLCKKYNKPVKMLPSSSLSSVTNALIESFTLQN